VDRNEIMTKIVDRVRTGLRQHAEYKRIHAELSALCLRELNDIGISSGDISRIARSAAYGA